MNAQHAPAINCRTGRVQPDQQDQQQEKGREQDEGRNGDDIIQQRLLEAVHPSHSELVDAHQGNGADLLDAHAGGDQLK